MSIPRNHHYLPQFYTSRWTSNGSMVRYVRARPDAALHQKSISPKAIGKEYDLYAYSTASSEDERQRLEMRFFQRIDDRAADALNKVDARIHGTIAEKVGLVQFVLSLPHRSPTRIAHLRKELSERMHGVGDFDATDPEHQAMIADEINNLISNLISSDNLIVLVASMKVFRIDVASKHKLLTCDLPLMMSQGVAQAKGFLLFPYAPDRLAIFAHEERVAWAFSSQEPDRLAAAINDAIVRQAREFVIAADNSSRRFVENRFLKNPEPVSGDGLLRWQVP